MRRNLGLRRCGGEGMWMSSQAQQQSYAVHEESWSSDSHQAHHHYQKQLPGMHMNFGGGGGAAAAAAFVLESELSNSNSSKQHGSKLGGSSHGMGMFQEKGSSKRRHGGRDNIFEEESLFHHRNDCVNVAAGRGKKFPFGSGSSNGSLFLNGGAKFSSNGGHNGYFSEEEEYESSSEEHHGGFFANSYDGNMKPHHGIRVQKVEFSTRGVF